MQYMRGLPNNAFEIAIVDPPYGIGDFAQSDRKHNGKIEWNEEVPGVDYFSELKRVSKRQIIWGANYYNCFEGGAIIWDKLNRHPSMSRCEIASVSFQKKVDYFQYEWHGYVVKKKDPNSFHPCAKPKALYKWLFETYVQQGWNVLDTHLGGGNIAIVAASLGYDFVGCEKDLNYYLAACEKLKAETDLGLFQIADEGSKGKRGQKNILFPDAGLKNVSRHGA